MKKFIAVLSALSLSTALTIGASAATLGDVNGDGNVNSNDALMILKYSVGLEAGDFLTNRADMNGDGQINSSDALTVLKTSVGLIDPEEILSEKSEILEFYNNAIDKTYSEAKKMDFILDDEYDLFYENDGENVKADTLEYEVEFFDGVDEYGYTPYYYAPCSDLTTDMIDNISIEKNGDRYVVELYIKYESVDIFNDPVYQCAGGMPFYYMNDEFDNYEYVCGHIDYLGTYIEAYIDKDGYITSFYVNVPYDNEYLIEYDFDGDIEYVQYHEMGHREHYIDIIL